MAGSGSGDLYAAAREYLDACYAALIDTPGGQPECHYVSPGVPAWDSIPSLIVHVGGPAVADTFPLQPTLTPGHRVAVQGQVNLISLTATVLRCAPVLGEDGEVPTDGDFDAASRETLADLWAIWAHLKQAKASEALFPPKSREWFFDPAVSVNISGGACGWQIAVRTQLDGYRPA